MIMIMIMIMVMVMVMVHCDPALKNLDNVVESLERFLKNRIFRKSIGNFESLGPSFFEHQI